MFMDDVERDEEALRAAIQKAIGRTDLPIEIITTGRWDLSALITDRFASGRVFIAGDAAHTLPPTRGGFGANTGIHDVHNLAWKLSAVLSGVSTPELLETYDAERRPVAWGRLEQTFVRPDYAKHAGGVADGVAILDEAAMEFGQLYRSTAVIGAGAELPPAARPDEWAGQPGTRAPHLWVEKGGARVSTLDLFERGWVLLADERSLERRRCGGRGGAARRAGASPPRRRPAARRHRRVSEGVRDLIGRRLADPARRRHCLARGRPRRRSSGSAHRGAGAGVIGATGARPRPASSE